MSAGSASSRRPQRGQSLVEFAVVAPLLILLIVIIIDFGRAFYVQVALQNGAREGARFGSFHPSWVNSSDNPDPHNIVFRATTEPGATVSDARVSVTCTTPGGTLSVARATSAQGAGSAFSSCAAAGGRIEVWVTSAFQPLTPIVGGVIAPDGLTLTGVTKMIIQ